MRLREMNVPMQQQQQQQQKRRMLSTFNLGWLEPWLRVCCVVAKSNHAHTAHVWMKIRFLHLFETRCCCCCCCWCHSVAKCTWTSTRSFSLLNSGIAIGRSICQLSKDLFLLWLSHFFSATIAFGNNTYVCVWLQCICCRHPTCMSSIFHLILLVYLYSSLSLSLSLFPLVLFSFIAMPSLAVDWDFFPSSAYIRFSITYSAHSESMCSHHFTFKSYRIERNTHQ